MFEVVDLYCERISADFWAEPVNALTNGAFLLAAWFVWRTASSHGQLTKSVCLLLALIASIGVGSFLFHTYATGWSRFLDVLPILLFQLLFVWVYCREIIGASIGTTFLLVMAYMVTAIIARQFPQLLNGSLIYGPALLTLSALGVYHWAARRRKPYMLISAMGVFMISLTFRTVDTAVCPHLALGSHFLWHLCNGIVVYLLMMGLLANNRKSIQ